MSDAIKPLPRFQIFRGGTSEPGLILVSDNVSGYMILRGSDAVLGLVGEMVDLANTAWKEKNEQKIQKTNDS